MLRMRTEYPESARTGEIPLGADCTGLEPTGGTLRCPGCGRRAKTLYVTPTRLSRCGDCFDSYKRAATGTAAG